MADTIRDIVVSVYFCGYRHERVVDWRRGGERTIHTNYNRKYIEIPLNTTTFEIPVFAFKPFCQMVCSNDWIYKSMIVAELCTEDKACKYKSIDAIMKSVLTEGFRNQLTKIEVQQDNQSVIYYATDGMVLDKNFIPIMMCSWIFKKVFELGRIHFRLERPLLRISPKVFLMKSNPMEKYLSNKITFACLEAPVIAPRIDFGDMIERPSITQGTVKIEIDNCPFFIREAAEPSVETTNDVLLQTVVDHIDELIQ